MEAWKSLYRDRCVPAERALKAVKSGDRVVLGHAAGEPRELVRELLRQAGRLRGVEIVHMVPLYPCEYAKPEYKESFTHNSLFVGAGSREAVNAGRADYTPCFFSEIPRLFRDRILPVDVALIQLSPPDKHGYMSFGVSVDYTMQAARSARLTIAEVNRQTPRTHGSYIHVSEVDLLVEADYSLPEIPLPEISEVEERIGAHVASLVPDGANLQLGIGAIPDAVLKFLGDKRDLGIHTEMFSDGVVHLFDLGVVTNRFNNLNPGKFTASFLMGTQRLYDFVHENPAVNMMPIDYTNSVRVAGALDNLISINSALEVDLKGQVCSEMIGSRQFSAVGGQVDFVRAASASAGGKSIIAFPSTGKNGSVSRIVADLSPGACVTTSRNDVHFVVTEYGVADLRGKTVRQRAEALVGIAHPDFRESLRAGKE
ncbi:MAG: acetyl-CoA hydrolase/transferase C-terminal domain-containing protein [Rectinemataceae bacterium]|jgi:4-hydroxybutyrate CoA-transferase